MLQADDILRGSQLAGSRLIRMLEDNDPDAFLLLQDWKCIYHRDYRGSGSRKVHIDRRSCQLFP